MRLFFAFELHAGATDSLETKRVGTGPGTHRHGVAAYIKIGLRAHFDFRQKFLTDAVNRDQLEHATVRHQAMRVCAGRFLFVRMQSVSRLDDGQRGIEPH